MGGAADAPTALRLENDVLVKKGKKVKHINCVEARHNTFNVCVGVVSQQSVNSTRILEIPFMTNAADVEEGEELLIEIPGKEKAKPKALAPAKTLTWKDQATADNKRKATPGSTKGAASSSRPAKKTKK